MKIGSLIHNLFRSVNGFIPAVPYFLKDFFVFRYKVSRNDLEYGEFRENPQNEPQFP